MIEIQIRENLLNALNVNPGEAVVRRRQNKLLVIAYPHSTLQPSDVPTTYEGYEVEFERRSFLGQPL